MGDMRICSDMLPEQKLPEQRNKEGMLKMKIVNIQYFHSYYIEDLLHTHMKHSIKCGCILWNAEKHTVILVETAYQGAPTGIFGVPKGNLERTDDSFLCAAIRETLEETGIKLCANSSLLHITVDRERKHCFVFPYKGDIPKLIPNTSNGEISKIIHIDPRSYPTFKLKLNAFTKLCLRRFINAFYGGTRGG
jgi:8-oxo-dGTP pyrophosphatase MutT (NUDIX family)